MCCWHQLPSGLSSRAGRSRGRSPIITWCWQFPSLSTNILLIKSKLKLESREIVVGVAMSPRNLGGKYRCRPHPRWRKCTRQFFFFREPERVNRNASEWRHHLHDDNIVDHVVYLKAEFLWHTVPSNENGEFYTCEVADVNNGIPIDFRVIKCVSVESGQPCRDNISWYI